jgi:hypothetical protein
VVSGLRTEHLAPERDNNWQNLCHVFQRHSCGCQMSRSILVGLDVLLLAGFGSDSSASKRWIVERKCGEGNFESTEDDDIDTQTQVTDMTTRFGLGLERINY